jgi:hypothetical protein
VSRLHVVGRRYIVCLQHLCKAPPGAVRYKGQHLSAACDCSLRSSQYGIMLLMLSRRLPLRLANMVMGLDGFCLGMNVAEQEGVFVQASSDEELKAGPFDNCTHVW